MPKYSIIITVYNCERYIQQCLNSVISQSFADWELIIVNDGSTDKSSIIVKEFKKRLSNKVILVEQENRGTVYSREYGIALASGEYLLFMDADDWWDNSLLESIDEIVNETNSDIIQFGYKFKDEIGNDVSDGGVFQKGGTGTGNIILDNNPDSFCYKALEACYCLWARVFKRKLFNTERGYYKKYYDISMTNDLIAFVKPLSIAKTYCFTDIYPYNYRIVNDSASHNITIDKVKSYFKSMSWAEMCMRETNGCSDSHKAFFSKRIAAIIFDEYRHNIYNASRCDIINIYNNANKISNINNFIELAVSEEKNWYKKAFLQLFAKRKILFPKLLLKYESIRKRITT